MTERQAQAPEVLEGTVEAVVFQNRDNGYTVLRVSGGGDHFTAVGTMPEIGPGELVTLTGRWTTHPSFGEQFKADAVQVRLPSGSQAVYRYLASGVIRGIGEKMAHRLVDRFGEETFQVLESDPDRLATMKGITPKKARAIQADFLEKAGMRSLLEFLASNALPVELGPRLWRVYGQGALEVLRSNPYVLLGGELEVDFATADRVASAAGLRADDPLRLEAGVLYTLSHNLDNGHVFLPRDKLLAAAGRLLGPGTEERRISPEDLEEALERLELRAQVVSQQVLGLEAVYRADLYEAEVAVAERLREMAGRELRPPEDLDELIDRAARGQGIAYAAQQREAVALAARSQVMLLTGGPGTGKTTTLRGILACYEAMELEVALAAPTGRAAKRLGELCGTEAYTIHRLLEAGYDRASGQLVFSRDEDDPLRAGAVIVDEMSMVDLPLMDALLRAVAGDCRLVLVGDPDQLPSVGPGQLFDHLIRSGVIPTVRLTEIFRQAQQSAIVMGAHLVNHGVLPPLENHGTGDLFFLRRTQGEAAVETIVELCKTRLPQSMGIPPGQIQVLSPTRRYVTGTANLNRALQEALNPPRDGVPELKYGSVVFRMGDRVMQVRNNYDLLWREADGVRGGLGVFNGDIGTVAAVDVRERSLMVNFDGRVVTYTSDLFNELELAYAMTVHKSQGSEYRAVILAAVSGAPMLLTRGVLYTAITRARSLLVIVGDRQVLERMVANDRQTRRYSGLRVRLTGELRPLEEENP